MSRTGGRPVRGPLERLEPVGQRRHDRRRPEVDAAHEGLVVVLGDLVELEVARRVAVVRAHGVGQVAPGVPGQLSVVLDLADEAEQAPGQEAFTHLVRHPVDRGAGVGGYAVEDVVGEETVQQDAHRPLVGAARLGELVAGAGSRAQLGEDSEVVCGLDDTRGPQRDEVLVDPVCGVHDLARTAPVGQQGGVHQGADVVLRSGRLARLEAGGRGEAWRHRSAPWAVGGALRADRLTGPQRSGTCGPRAAWPLRSSRRSGPRRPGSGESRGRTCR